ncbi:uncharacterized protein BT62DRAFT_1070871 [Guyanagaster necrorhizus]|uniref:Uncharacterized protein n=1 Tax=Guyanagaster necrorhizus TaxID=856835 RepID=A0A9P8AZ11_9AGAR|nr:uncharacterized protein BT62DRAFT_1070871 [Guyanagaster necrorhizus MCA 3950]KAG7453213.1 hypothetical protein BT62DRAFT_1070871 [Guyanagaster necrorhizus MCA 3950]
MPCIRANKDTATPPPSRLSGHERKAILASDRWVDPKQLKPQSVVCLACGTHVKLDRGKQYYLRCWNYHKERCIEIIASGEASKGPGVLSSDMQVDTMSEGDVIYSLTEKGSLPPKLARKRDLFKCWIL